jgi:hypothetical protein
MEEGYEQAIAILRAAEAHEDAELVRGDHEAQVPPWAIASELRERAAACLAREEALIRAAHELDRLAAEYVRRYGVLPDRWLCGRDEQDAKVLGYQDPAAYYAAHPPA